MKDKDILDPNISVEDFTLQVAEFRRSIDPHRTWYAPVCTIYSNYLDFKTYIPNRDITHTVISERLYPIRRFLDKRGCHFRLYTAVRSPYLMFTYYSKVKVQPFPFSDFELINRFIQPEAGTLRVENPWAHAYVSTMALNQSWFEKVYVIK